jgi:HEAT repeat protein
VRQALYQRFMRQGVTSSPIADRLVADMLADEEGAIRGHAVGWIADRRAAQDTPIFVRALSDPDTGVRHAAAVALRGAYDRTAIEALVAALDDPVAAVRDEALKALQTIEEFERQKEKWRKFAEEAK